MIVMTTLVTDSNKIAKLIHSRSNQSKKGDNGVILIVGGSRIYHGAPLLASLAAMRSGSDLVYVAVPKSISTALRSYSPNLIVLPLPDDYCWECQQTKSNATKEYTCSCHRYGFECCQG